MLKAVNTNLLYEIILKHLRKIRIEMKKCSNSETMMTIYLDSEEGPLMYFSDIKVGLSDTVNITLPRHEV